jgi:hypothetical protein
VKFRQHAASLQFALEAGGFPGFSTDFRNDLLLNTIKCSAVSMARWRFGVFTFLFSSTAPLLAHVIEADENEIALMSHDIYHCRRLTKIGPASFPQNRDPVRIQPAEEALA